MHYLVVVFVFILGSCAAQTPAPTNETVQIVQFEQEVELCKTEPESVFCRDN